MSAHFFQMMSPARANSTCLRRILNYANKNSKSTVHFSGKKQNKKAL